MQKCLEVIKKAVSLHRLSKVIELWCNGNTADFGSVILSSSLGGSTVEESTVGVFLYFFIHTEFPFSANGVSLCKQTQTAL